MTFELSAGFDPSLPDWESNRASHPSKKPLQAHPCALISGHPWPSKFFGGVADPVAFNLSVIAPQA
jgi:hypothetical protein